MNFLVDYLEKEYRGGARDLGSFLAKKAILELDYQMLLNYLSTCVPYVNSDMNM